MRRNRSALFASLTFLLLSCGAVSSATARDRDFQAVVRTIEARYHAKRTSPFLMRAAGLITKAARPEGIKSLSLAVFEDQDFSPRPDDAEFEISISEALEKKWTPLVRVWSRRDGERTQIYCRESGEDVRLFIVTLEPDEAVVMEVGINAKTFAQWMDDPENIGPSLRQGSSGENSSVAAEPSLGPSPPLRHRDLSDGQNR